MKKKHDSEMYIFFPHKHKLQLQYMQTLNDYTKRQVYTIAPQQFNVIHS